MCWLTDVMMVKTNSTISLLSKLHNFRLLEVLNNPQNSTAMLNVDKGIALVDNRSKTLQTHSANAICSADTEHEVQTSVTLKQCQVCISIPECETRVPQTHVSTSKREVRVLPPKRETRILSTPKCEICILPVPKCDSRVSNTKREVRVMRQTLPTLKIHVSIPRVVCVSNKKM